MSKKFELNWELFCDESCKDMLDKLEESNEEYAELICEYKDLNAEVSSFIVNNKELTEENIEDMKKLIMLYQDVHDIEKKAIYSRGICNGIMLSEKFA